MFHNFKNPCFTCTFFTKFIYNEYIVIFIDDMFTFRLECEYLTQFRLWSRVGTRCGCNICYSMYWLSICPRMADQILGRIASLQFRKKEETWSLGQHEWKLVHLDMALG